MIVGMRGSAPMACGRIGGRFGRSRRPIRGLQLRERCRVVDDLQTDERRLTNRLREQLLRVHAAWLELSPAADDPWLWTVLATTPHPVRGRSCRAGVSPRRSAPIAFDDSPADDIVRRLREPRLTAAPGVADAVKRGLRPSSPSSC